MLKNKKLLILTSLLTLLPIPVGLLLWDRFPDLITTHWGFDGQADGWSSIPFTVFGMPLIMLVIHFICLAATLLDSGNKNRNKKMLTIVLWIIPLLSNLCSGIIYALSLGLDFSVSTLMMAAMGLLFAAIGNYLPKTRMNSTMGIKVPWAYTSEENWNATHRFAGKIWMAGGILMVLGAFLPEAHSVIVMFAIILVLTVVPVVYSWQYWKKQTAEGSEVKSFPKAETAITKAALVFLAIILIFVLIILFTGDIEYQFYDESFSINADWYSDLTVMYDIVESVEYREGNVPGSRVGGFGSFRLLMGFFNNEEFGTHTRYTYYKPEACIVVTTQRQTLVLSGRIKAETQEIYQHLINITGEGQ